MTIYGNNIRKVMEKNITIKNRNGQEETKVLVCMMKDA